jgi:hypothetical protein
MQKLRNQFWAAAQLEAQDWTGKVSLTKLRTPVLSGGNKAANLTHHPALSPQH